jgi:hypothetical protein
MTMKTHIQARRIGECTGDEINAKGRHAPAK